VHHNGIAWIIGTESISGVLNGFSDAMR